jgi:hypothetical protein
MRYGAIKIPLPNVQQTTSFSCGAAVFQAVCSYFGVGPETQEDFIKDLRTTRKAGTEPEKIISWAEHWKLKAEFRPGMTVCELKRCIDQGRPVICSMQAWGKAEEYDQKYHNGHYKDLDGHFIVAIGYDDENFYFEDPVLVGRRGFIPIEEFGVRWHDKENSGRYVHLGLVVWKDDGEEPTYLRVARYIE